MKLKIGQKVRLKMDYMSLPKGIIGFITGIRDSSSFHCSERGRQAEFLVKVTFSYEYYGRTKYTLTEVFDFRLESPYDKDEQLEFDFMSNNVNTVA